MVKLSCLYKFSLLSFVFLHEFLHVKFYFERLYKQQTTNELFTFLLKQLINMDDYILDMFKFPDIILFSQIQDV